MSFEKYKVLIGKTMKSVKAEDDTLIFTDLENNQYIFYHQQECCEDVIIDDICGDLNDLVGNPILQAEKVCSDEIPPKKEIYYEDASYTWTFYKFSTIKGSVTVKWFGISNGYYSEEVDFIVKNNCLQK